MKPIFYRYRDLTAETANRDFHIHTARTDGKATIDEILARAEEIGLAQIAFTEHARAETSWYQEFADEVRRKRERASFTVFVGVEVRAKDNHGTVDVSSKIADNCEIILGSVHRFSTPDGGVLEFNRVSPEEFAEREFDMAMGLVKHGPINVLAHPGGMYERRHGFFPESYFRAILEASLERGIAVEINSSYLRNFKQFLRLCEEINPYVSIGSDVHTLEDIGHCRDLLREQRIS